MGPEKGSSILVRVAKLLCLHVSIYLKYEELQVRPSLISPEVIIEQKNESENYEYFMDFTIFGCIGTARDTPVIVSALVHKGVQKPSTI